MISKEFIKSLAPSVQKICQKYNLFSSVCIAQAAIESGWGQYTIGKYNFFGRLSAVGDKVITVSTQEYMNGNCFTVVEEFKDYDYLDEAIEDYCRLFTNDPYYAEVLNHLDDLDAYVESLSKLYPFDPDYNYRILSIIRANHLTDYD